MDGEFMELGMGGDPDRHGSPTPTWTHASLRVTSDEDRRTDSTPGTALGHSGGATPSTNPVARRVLLVRTGADFGTEAVAFLSRFGFAVATAATRAEALERAGASDLIVLDLDVADSDGLDLCAKLAREAPLVVVAASGEETDRVIALELGADDYLTKPFPWREFVARCRSVLRRAQRQAEAHSVVRVGDLEIDMVRHEARRNGSVIHLTTKERELLVALARHHGGVVPRARLVEEVWGTGSPPTIRAFDLQMMSLRRKLGDTRHCRYIATVRGAGFRLLR